MEKEFTDEEIMKGLECCGIKQTCSECPYNNLEFGNCEDDIKADAFEVMSRDKEMIRALIAGQETLGRGIEEKNKEIEGLKLELQIATQKRVNMFEIIEHFERGRASGINELAERFKSEVSHIPGWGSVAEKKIDSIVEKLSAKEEEK